MTTIADLRVDEITWSVATPLRRAEWRVCRDEVVEEGRFAPTLAGRYLLATPNEHAVVVEALDDQGYVQRALHLERLLLQDVVHEYAAIIRRLDENADRRDASWFEAVDMAKKVVHDKAASAILRVPDFAVDLPTARRVFTFYFALVVDTTRMQHARGHRILR